MIKIKICVTGNSTFAGKNFVERFKDKYEIKPISDDIFLEECDAIINFHALIEAPHSLLYPMQHFKENIEKTMHLLEATRRLKTKPHFIQPSSNLIYGNPIYTPIDEKHPLNPQSPYAATRICQEMLAMSYYNSFGLPVTILRLSNGYGPHGTGVINQFIKNAKEGKPLIIKGGFQTRTFTHIYDFCDAIVLALENPNSIGNIFNISGPETIPIDKLAELIRDFFFPNAEIKGGDFDKGDITSNDFKISHEKAKSLLGYKHEFDLIKGIQQVIDYEG